MSDAVSPNSIIEPLRVEVHVYSGKGASSFRVKFMEGAPADWVAKAVAQNVPEMVELARAKNAEIQASEQ